MSAPPLPSRPGLLLVDDDPLIVDTLAIVLGSRFDVVSAGSHDAALQCLDSLPQPPAIALVDLGLPPVPHEPTEGYRLVTSLLVRQPSLKVVVLSGQDAEAAGRHARALGAVEFVAKPVRPSELLRILGDLASASDAESASRPADRGAGAGPLDALIGESAPIAGLKTQIRLCADSPFPVLIEGESGSGKEIAAAALHALSRRQARAYLALNCAAISPSLVEPTLFGFAKGAFTGAVGAKAGYFEEAQDGTLFLDEIGELPLELQAKLLRVLENGEYNRVGETQPRKSRARIIAATNRDLRAESRAGAFRPDLYHRLSVFTIRVPPLRDLGDDKLALFEHFARIYAAAAGVPPVALDAEARRLWLEYPFPGNVRELRNIVIRLVAKHHGGNVAVCDLETELDSGSSIVPAPAGGSGGLEATAQAELERGEPFVLDARLALWERAYVTAAMKLAGGNVSKAARLLGINRTTLYSRMAALDREG
ncbi:MAG: sigma-54-dependent Fis family transcriptional regulator [Burkholderiales bacterium]|nr:sigma-54-dependent Fis family transcriptional regulator [Burkholderiales bacterium]